MTAFVPTDAAVWFEIPVSDFDRARAFYAKVLQNETKVAGRWTKPDGDLCRQGPVVRRPAISIPARRRLAAPAAPSISLSPHRSRKRWSV